VYNAAGSDTEKEPAPFFVDFFYNLDKNLEKDDEKYF